MPRGKLIHSRAWSFQLIDGSLNHCQFETMLIQGPDGVLDGLDCLLNLVMFAPNPHAPHVVIRGQQPRQMIIVEQCRDGPGKWDSRAGVDHEVSPQVYHLLVKLPRKPEILALHAVHSLVARRLGCPRAGWSWFSMFLSYKQNKTHSKAI